MQKRRYGNGQSGRSMIEMLGVLAIVGILAVVGIVGYQYALRLYRIAETYDEVSVTVSGARTWPILEHYGELTKIGAETQAPRPHADTYAYVVPIREVVSKVNYRNALTAAEAIEFGVSNKEYLDDSISDASEAAASYYAKREYESFSSKTLAPVWVRAETPEAWSVRITGLSYDMCSTIVSKRELGYQYAYMALSAGGTPLDPNYWDFPLIDEKKRYSNKDMSVFENVKELCESIDPLHRSVPPAYTFQNKYSELNKKDSGISSVGGECGADDGVPSVRCMAYSARVDDLPLQTLVLYWGNVDNDGGDLPICQPGTCRNIHDEPTEYCCETEAKGLWIGNGICCALGERLDSPMTVKINGKYYSLEKRLTGVDTDGRAVESCQISPPTEESCCIAGTAWFVGDVPTKGSGTCSGDCPAGPEGNIIPDQTESKFCCETQMKGVWKLKPGNPTHMRAPEASNPKSSDRNSGGALCCWNGSSKILSYDSSNPMSCDAPNIWSKKTATISTTVQIETMRRSVRTCSGPSSSSGGSSDPSDTNDGDRPGGEAGDEDGSVNIDGDECIRAQVVPPLDIYGQQNPDCCPTEKKNGFLQVTPYIANNVSEECCRAMNLPDMAKTPNDEHNSYYDVRYAQGSGRLCEAECCDIGYIDYAADNFKKNETNATYKSNIFLTAKGSSNPKICCQVIEGKDGHSAKANHPDCCETNLAYDVSDKAEKWVPVRTTITYTVYDPSTKLCSVASVSSTRGTCCKKGENGFDVECNENIFCCGDNVEENMKSRTCCPLVPNHIWDDEKNECVPCNIDGTTVCGEYCDEIDVDGERICCIKNINGCFEPYEWDPKDHSVKLHEACCKECLADQTKRGKFKGFTKAAKDKKDKISGNCVTGFTMRSSSGK